MIPDVRRSAAVFAALALGFGVAVALLKGEAGGGGSFSGT